MVMVSLASGDGAGLRWVTASVATDWLVSCGCRGLTACSRRLARPRRGC